MDGTSCNITILCIFFFLCITWCCSESRYNNIEAHSTKPGNLYYNDKHKVTKRNAYKFCIICLVKPIIKGHDWLITLHGCIENTMRSEPTCLKCALCWSQNCRRWFKSFWTGMVRCVSHTEVKDCEFKGWLWVKKHTVM